MTWKKNRPAGLVVSMLSVRLRNWTPRPCRPPTDSTNPFAVRHKHLDMATRTELNILRRSDLPATDRDRVEMVALSDAGWSPPRIAGHLGYHSQTVRERLRDFLARGTDALLRRRPGPDIGRRDEVARALTELLGEGHTWTSRQMSPARASRGLAIGPRQTRRYLERLKAGYRRITDILKHKQDPAKAEQAGRILGNLRRKAAAGRLKFYYLDECGFSPTLPAASEPTAGSLGGNDQDNHARLLRAALRGREPVFPAAAEGGRGGIPPRRRWGDSLAGTVGASTDPRITRIFGGFRDLF